MVVKGSLLNPANAICRGMSTFRLCSTASREQGVRGVGQFQQILHTQTARFWAGKRNRIQQFFFHGQIMRAQGSDVTFLTVAAGA